MIQFLNYYLRVRPGWLERQRVLVNFTGQILTPKYKTNYMQPSSLDQQHKAKAFYSSMKCFWNMAAPALSSLSMNKHWELRGLWRAWKTSQLSLIKESLVFQILQLTFGPPFALSARESLVCLLCMTSLPEYEPFPINLHGPQGFQPMRSGNKQGDYEEASPLFFIRFNFYLVHLLFNRES